MGSAPGRVSFDELDKGGALTIGDGYRTRRDELGRPGFPILRVAQIGDGAIDGEPTDYIRHEYERAIGPKLSKADDVVLTTKGTFGRRTRIRPRQAGYAYSPQVCWFRVQDPARLDPGYLYYWLGSADFANQASGLKSQTDMADYLSLRDLRRVRVPMPAVAEQRRIAGILGTLDDKIELNSLFVARLVQLSRLVFDVRLNAMKAQEPVEPLTVGDVVEVLETGGRPQGGVSAYNDGVPRIGAESITGLGEFDFSKTKYVPVDYYAAMRRGKLENRDVLLYKDGGRPGLFEPHATMVGDGFPFETAAINEHVYRLRARPPYTQTLLYLWLSGAEAMNEMRVKGTGVAIPGLNSTALRSIHVPAFMPDAASELDRILEPLVARVLLVARESRVLAQTRDLLLPRLLGAPEMR